MQIEKRSRKGKRFYLCTSWTTNSGSGSAEEERKEGVRRERAKRRMKHERAAIISLLFVLSGEVGGELWLNYESFIEWKNNNKKRERERRRKKSRE